MADIKSRDEFTDYCLRRLGAPVISINVAPDQVNDRIDEAIQTWQEKHYDGTEKHWLGYKLTQTDLDNGYITMPKSIMVVDQIMSLSTLYNASNNDRLFGYKYQTMIKNLSPFQPLDTINYYLTMTNLGEVENLVNTTERFEFTKHKNKLNIYRGFEYMVVDDVICLHAYSKIDPDNLIDPSDAWNDKWLKLYATALIKQQFGQNMKKHGEIQLLGGVTVNGQQIFDEATAELEKLEETLQETYQEPVNFFVG